jgi:hypothetical protein
MKVTEDFKMVIVIDETLPVGLIANTAAVLALSLGEKLEGLIGEDLQDKDENSHAGLTEQVLPILKDTTEGLKEIKRKSLVHKELFIVDVTDVAQKCKNYDEYKQLLATKTDEALQFFGIALAGPTKIVNSITGNHKLLR